MSNATKTAVAAIIAAGLSVAQAEARCAGTVRDPLTPQNPRCDPGQFLNPIFGQPQWYRQNPVDRSATLYQCTHPNNATPPASWCRAAFAAETGKWGR